jgi:hypothetical protein
MRRTQIYLTEEQDERLKRLAADRGSSKAEVIRSILDRELDGDGARQDDRAVIRSTAGACADYPDWPEWLDDVRGQSASDRLAGLGL